MSADPRGAAACRAAAATCLATALAAGLLLTLHGLRASAAPGMAPAPPALVLHHPTVTWPVAPNSSARLSLTRRGRPIASAEAPPGTRRPLRLALRDASGSPVPVAPGDLLRATSDEGHVEALLPELGLRELADGRLRIEGPEARPFTVELGTGARAEPVARLQGQLSPAGRATLRPPGTWSSVHARWALLQVDAPGPLLVGMRWQALRVMARLGAAKLHGVGSPGPPVSATLWRGQRQLATGRAQTAHERDGAFELQLANAAGAPEPLAAGMELRVAQDADVTLAGLLPPLSARLLPVEDIVVGTAPAGRRLEVLRRLGDQEEVLRAVTVSATGRFSVAVGALHDLRRDEPIDVRIHQDWLRVVAPALSERLTLTLGSASVQGRSPLGGSVALALRDDSGAAIADALAVADPAGFIHADLMRDGRAQPVAAGHSILAVWDLGGAIRGALPDLDVVVSPRDGRLEGRAPPGAELWARLDSGQGAPPRRLRADASGRFTTQLGVAPWPVGTRGRVVLPMPSGLDVVRPFGVSAITATLGEAGLRGAGPAGGSSQLHLERAGLPLASSTPATTDTAATGPWSLVFRGPQGWPVPARPGDVLRWEQGTITESAAVPAIVLAANAETDVVRGHVAPAQEATLRLRRGSQVLSQVLRLDPQGVFRLHTVGAGWDLRLGDAISVTAVQGGFRFVEHSIVPGLVVDLDDGRVQGEVGPALRVTAGLYAPDGQRRASGAATADRSGTFELQLRDRLGQALPPHPLEVLVVQAGTAVTTTSIPSLSLRADRRADSVSGNGPPGGALRLTAERPSDDRGRFRHVSPRRLGGDRWEADLAGQLDVGAGSIIRVAWQDVQAHRFERGHRLAQLRGRIGGRLVEAVVGPTARYTITAQQDGRHLGGAVGRAGAAGQLSALLDDDEATAARPLRSEDELHMAWHGGLRTPRSGALGLTLRPLSVTLRNAPPRVEGHAPPGTWVQVLLSGLGGSERPPGLHVQSDELGRFMLPVERTQPLAAGTSVEAALLDADGHATVDADLLPWLDVRLERDAVSGRARPDSSVELTLLDEQRRSLAEGRTSTSATGAFVISPRDGSGQARPPQGATALRLLEAEGRITELELPTLELAIDTGAGVIHGRAPAREMLELRLWAAGRATATVVTTTDENGRVHLAGDALPTGFEIERLQRAELRWRSPIGHRVSATADGPAAPLPPTPATPAPSATSTAVPDPSATPPQSPGTASPTPDRAHRLWLPYVVRDRLTDPEPSPSG